MSARRLLAVAAGILGGLVVGFALGVVVASIDWSPTQPRAPRVTIRDVTPRQRSVNIEASRGVAVARWGPVCGGTRVRVRYSQLKQGQTGEASYAFDPARPRDASRFRRCRIIVNPVIRLTRREFCAVVVHEYGHLAGKEHVGDPRDVMYPRLSQKNIPRACGLSAAVRESLRRRAPP